MNTKQDIAYKNAQIRVQKLKKFYSHLVTYLVINVFISFIRIFEDVNNGSLLTDALLDSNNYSIWFYWGIGLALHALSVFGIPMLISKDWEQRKIRQFMEEETNNKIK